MSRLSKITKIVQKTKTEMKQVYRVAQKVSYYQVSPLNRIKTAVKAIFSSILSMKWTLQYNKSVLNILCVNNLWRQQLLCLKLRQR